jgi:phage shock protein PspC (stress-responsive transcriptional regulator)
MWRLCATWQDWGVATTDLLHRSVTDARVAGVCGGIAERYRIDPLLVRLAAVIIALSSGVGLVLYGAAWLLLPRGAGQPAMMRAFPRVARVRSRTWSVVVSGAALVVLVLVGMVFNASLLPTIAVLGILYASQLRPGTKGSPAPTGGAAAPQTYPTMPAPAGAQWPLLAPPPGELIITTPAGPWRPTNRFGQPLTAADCAAYYAVPDPIGLYQRPSVAVPMRRSRIVALICGLAIAALFAMMSLLGAFVSVPPVTYLAVGLAGVGLALIVGAFVGRPSGFIAIAIALVLLAGAVTSSAPNATSSMTQGLTATSDLPSEISATGDYNLDLSQAQIDETKTVDIRVDGGDAQVILPATGNVTVVYDDQYGVVTLDGPSGQSGEWHRITDPNGPTLTISITVTLGDLDVTG